MIPPKKDLNTVRDIMSNAERDYLDDHLKATKEKTAPDLDDDVFFEKFCAQQILKFRDLDVEELALGETRGDGDGGIDSAYFFCDGKLVKDGMLTKDFSRKGVPLNLILIQATRASSFENDYIRRFEDTVNDLLDPKLVGTSSQLY